MALWKRLRQLMIPSSRRAIYSFTWRFWFQFIHSYVHYPDEWIFYSTCLFLSCSIQLNCCADVSFIRSDLSFYRLCSFYASVPFYFWFREFQTNELIWVATKTFPDENCFVLGAQEISNLAHSISCFDTIVESSERDQTESKELHRFSLTVRARSWSKGA